ncbi:MAG: recombinase family protein [Synergistaceae bacterium]|nr:recombinase family protein [Synergistaceae bacterium]
MNMVSALRNTGGVTTAPSKAERQSYISSVAVGEAGTEIDKKLTGITDWITAETIGAINCADTENCSDCANSVNSDSPIPACASSVINLSTHNVKWKPEPELPNDLRIPTAAYCRVSTLSDAQDGSFETQCAYYANLITKNPTMRLVGIYGDHGKSGRSMTIRPELQRLIHDCEQGKVKLILTKSISRFARNMLECVETIRHLSALGVKIHFEKEQFESDSQCGELMLSILAAIAQEESNSISRNLIWSRNKHVERGEPWEKARYGYISVGKNHRWQVIPQEAEIVCQAFFMAGMCFRYPQILQEMNRMESKNGTSQIWQHGTLKGMLRSLVYVGDYMSNKYCKIVNRDGTSKIVRNKGQVDQILIQGHHEAIIHRDLFDVVQELIKYGLLSATRRKFSDTEFAIMDRARAVTQTIISSISSIATFATLPNLSNLPLMAANSTTTLQESTYTPEPTETRGSGSTAIETAAEPAELDTDCVAAEACVASEESEEKGAVTSWGV